MPTYFTSTKFIAIGWIRSFRIEKGDDLVPLAVSDPYDKILTSNRSIAYRVNRDGNDYRLAFNNSKSKLIRREKQIQLDDGKWHFIGYTSIDDDGNMRYYVDGEVLPTESGIDGNGLLYSKAYNENVRIGGGNVYCPALYKPKQSVTVYNWRCGIGFTLNDSWVKEIYEADKEFLEKGFDQPRFGSVTSTEDVAVEPVGTNHIANFYGLGSASYDVDGFIRVRLI